MQRITWTKLSVSVAIVSSFEYTFIMASRGNDSPWRAFSNILRTDSN